MMLSHLSREMGDVGALPASDYAQVAEIVGVPEEDIRCAVITPQRLVVLYATDMHVWVAHCHMDCGGAWEVGQAVFVDGPELEEGFYATPRCV